MTPVDFYAPTLTGGMRKVTGGEWVHGFDYHTLEARWSALLGEHHALRDKYDRAIGHLEDICKADDGQAWKEARRFLDSLEDKT